jgi:hypothetical protein
LKNVFFYGVTLSIIFLAAFSTFSCKSDSSNPVNNSYDANTINGTITFVDTLFISDTTNGYYSVDAYTVWPPTNTGPTAYTKIIPQKAGGKYTANYKIIVPTNAPYTITAAYIRLPYIQGSVYGLGMYDVAGKDTVHNDSLIFSIPHPKATITGGTGIGNINFNCWIDTAKKIYKF